MDSRNKDSHSLPEPLLKRLSELVQKHLGLDYPASRWKDLERGIKATAKDFQLQSFRDVAEQLVHSPHDTRKFNALAQNLTIGETYFFREKAIFQVLKKQIIPEL
ncbi:MAG: chemotaxis protein CheR, partial [Methanobacteriota archaeon]